MALWQFTLALIPSPWAEQHPVAALFTEEGVEPAIAWVGFTLTKELIAGLSALLPPGSSWDSELLVWGSDKTEDIQLFMGAGGIESLTVRLDMRAPNPVLIHALAQLCQKFGLRILALESRHYINPDKGAIAEAAARSRAASLVSFLPGSL